MPGYRIFLIDIGTVVQANRKVLRKITVVNETPASEIKSEFVWNHRVPIASTYV